MSRTAEDGTKTILREGIELQRYQYNIVYFNELPLSLEKDESPRSSIKPSFVSTLPTGSKRIDLIREAITRQ